MRKFIVVGVVTAAFAMPAFASDVEDNCIASRSAEGVDTSGCACVAEIAAADPAIAEALASIETREEFEALDQSIIDQVQACFPDA